MEQNDLSNASNARTTRGDILDQLTLVLREVFFNDDLVASPDLTADGVEGWDSLGHVRLLVEIESSFSVRFQVTEISSLKNVGQLVDLIQKKMQHTQ